MLGIGIDQWMSGAWGVSPVAGQDILKDVNGVNITVNTIVKFVGIVSAINANDPHFGDITITPLHPGLETSIILKNPDLIANKQFYPLQLVVGN